MGCSNPSYWIFVSISFSIKQGSIPKLIIMLFEKRLEWFMK